MCVWDGRVGRTAWNTVWGKKWNGRNDWSWANVKESRTLLTTLCMAVWFLLMDQSRQPSFFRRCLLLYSSQCLLCSRPTSAQLRRVCLRNCIKAFISAWEEKEAKLNTYIYIRKVVQNKVTALCHTSPFRRSSATNAFSFSFFPHVLLLCLPI